MDEFIKNNIEIRSFQTELTTSEDNESRVIRGLAIPIESRSELLNGEFYEVIRSSAVNNDLILNNDIRLLVNHDEAQGTYGRSKRGKGSLKLYITERGLEFETELPNNAYGNYLLDGIRRGDFDEMSFAFIVDKDEWKKNNDGTYERSIVSFGLLTELSVLSVKAAYSATNVNVRSLESFKEEVRAKEEAEKQAQVESLKKIAELEDDFNDLYKNFLNTAY